MGSQAIDSRIKLAANQVFTEVSLVSLKERHSFLFDAFAKEVIECNDLTSLLRISISDPFLFLGEGSNVAFIENFEGRILQYTNSELNIVERDNDFLVEVGAGHNWHFLVMKLLEKGIPGLENLALIPGTVGAAPIQNIGAYGRELKEFCDYLCIYDIKSKEQFRLSAAECEFGYRDSVFKRPENKHFLITKLALKIPKNWKPDISYKGLDHLSLSSTPNEIFDVVVALRRSKLPDHKEIGNAGSFFKNPIVDSAHYRKLQQSHPTIPGFTMHNDLVKVPAAWCIDQLGFKGKAFGGIGAYHKQPLVLVNLGNGMGAELVSFAREIKSKVKLAFDIDLVNEVTLMGSHGVISL